MKVKLTITLDVGDHMNGFSKPEIIQNIFDDYINYVTVCHARDAVTWCAKDKSFKEQGSNQAELIYKHHDLWRELTQQPVWDLEEIK